MTITKSLQALIIAALSAVLCVQAPLARAELIATDQLVAPSSADQDRAKVEAFLERADIRQKLSAMGVNGLAANDRVAALSDAEVHTLAQKINSLPAGGNLSNNDLIIILLIVILVAIIV